MATRTVSAWRRSLRRASFRGAAFLVNTSDHETGRRAVTHEFPGRDVPYTEDLGRKARTHAVEAYVLGPDYMPARDALLQACEAEGPGRLITPWTGEAMVICTGCRLRESRADGGMATFSLTFAEAGEAASPGGAPMAGARASVRADDALDAADADLDRSLALDGQPEPVLRDTLAGMRDMASAARRARSVMADPQGWAANLALIDDISVAQLAAAVPSDLLRPLFADGSALSASGHTARAGEMLSLASTAPAVTMPEGAGTMRTTAAENRAALAAYQRRAATAEAARSAALSTPASRAEAATLRENVTDAVDGVLDGAADDGVFAAFTDLQAATVQALAESAGSAPDVVTVRQQAVQPSLVVAHCNVTDRPATEAEAQILARNRVRHPGFVPPGELEVLRNAQ